MLKYNKYILNFQPLAITHILLICDQTYANLDIWTLIPLTIPVIYLTC